jgi:uncharacterized protein YjbJ (UPF0337 family)
LPVAGSPLDRRDLVAQVLLVSSVSAATSNADHLRRRSMSSGKADELKGRVKEAAGALTNDGKLRRQGKVDQAVGKIKQKTEKVLDKVKDAIE